MYEIDDDWRSMRESQMDREIGQVDVSLPPPLNTELLTLDSIQCYANSDSDDVCDADADADDSESSKV